MLFDRIRYFLGVIFIIPVFPIMYFQAKKIKRDFPDLPEAQNPIGRTGQPASKSILIMGESSVAGVGVDVHDNGIAGQMSHTLRNLQGEHIAYQVVAKSGYTAERVHQKLMPKVPDQTFDLVLIGLGGNDTFQTKTPWFWKKHMGILIDSLHKRFPDTPIVVTCMPPVHTFTAFSSLLKFFLGGLTKLFGHEIRRMSRKRDYLYYFDYVITLEEWIERYEEANEPADFFSDGVHPSALTYKLWGGETAKFIHKNGCLKSEAVPAA
mgnify:CR=1 FL=1